MRKSKSKKAENGNTFTEEDDEPLAKVASSASEDYEVESVVGVRKRKGRTEYKVHWKGYSNDEDSWEDVNNLNCQELIDAFNNANEDTASSGRKKKRGRPSKTTKGKKPKKTSKGKDDDGDGDDGGKEGEGDDDDDEKEYEVEKIIEVQQKRNGQRLFLVRWKGYTKSDDSWQTEESLNCQELIDNFMKKVDMAKLSSPRETRVNPKRTDHYRLPPPKTGRTHKRRNDGARRTYNEDD